MAGVTLPFFCNFFLTFLYYYIHSTYDDYTNSIKDFYFLVYYLHLHDCNYEFVMLLVFFSNDFLTSL